MIKNILDLLPYVKEETENIQIAKGKYKYPESIKKHTTILKKDIWQQVIEAEIKMIKKLYQA